MGKEYDYHMNGVNQLSHMAHIRPDQAANEIIHLDEALVAIFRTHRAESEGFRHRCPINFIAKYAMKRLRFAAPGGNSLSSDFVILAGSFLAGITLF